MDQRFDLDGMTMNAVQTAPNGVVSEDTHFHFHQDGERVHADYSGGRVERGYLVGLVEDATFEFCYCQIHTDGSIDNGRSQCELRIDESGAVQVVEHFEWGGGSGTNVIQQLRKPGS